MISLELRRIEALNWERAAIWGRTAVKSGLAADRAFFDRTVEWAVQTTQNANLADSWWRRFWNRLTMVGYDHLGGVDDKPGGWECFDFNPIEGPRSPKPK